MKFLDSKNIYLRPFLKSDITNMYLSWLNDNEVNQYSVRRIHPYSDIEAFRYLDSMGKDEKILAICTQEEIHVGNIKYGPIDWPNRNCEISIIIGEKEYWNKGIAFEAMNLLINHLFDNLHMHRIGVDSCNPAFIKMAKKLGFVQEGIMRERMDIGGQRTDYVILGLLKVDFAKTIERL